MNRINTYLISFISCVLLAACANGSLEESESYGYLTVGVSDELKDIVQMKSDSDERIYRLDIYDSKGNLDETIDNHNTVSDVGVNLLSDLHVRVFF